MGSFKERQIEVLIDISRKVDLILVLLGTRSVLWLECEIRKNKQSQLFILSEEQLAQLITSAQVTLEEAECRLYNTIGSKKKKPRS